MLGQNRFSHTFEFWSSNIDIVETLLIFVRATQKSNWELHLLAVRSMMPWYFAYGKTHSARSPCVLAQIDEAA